MTTLADSCAHLPPQESTPTLAATSTSLPNSRFYQHPTTFSAIHVVGTSGELLKDGLIVQ